MTPPEGEAFRDDRGPGERGQAPPPRPAEDPAAGAGSASADSDTIDGTESPSVVPPPEFGLRKIGPYEILSLLGKGGMGVVYEAFQPTLKRKVALKVLIAGEDASEDALARFRREAEAVAKLGHHPNVVPVYDVGAVSGHEAGGGGHRHYIAMHLVEGLPLDKVLDEGALPPLEAARIASKIADALAHAHGRGILHRDVKPGNILIALPEGATGRPGDRVSPESGKRSAVSGEKGFMEVSGKRSAESGEKTGEPTHAAHRSPLTADWEPMLTDFGLAKDVDSSTRLTYSGATVGTPHYMSPEQASGRLDRIDARSDVFSLGATLYEMLTLTPPFRGTGVIEVLSSVVRDDPAPLRRLNPAVPADLQTVCLKALEKDPSKRFQSAAEFRDDLERFLAGLPVAAKPASALDRLFRRLKRNPALSAALAALVLLAAAAAAFGLTALRGIDESRKAVESAADRSAKEARLKEKGERVSTVLLAGFARLGALQARLKAAAVDPAFDEEALRKLYTENSRIVEDFGKTVAADDTSRSAWLSMKGWLLSLGRFERESAEGFAQARKADPEVPWGYVFEAIALLGRHILELPVPMLLVGPFGQSYGPSDPMPPLAAERKARIEALLSDAAGTAVFGRDAATRLLEMLSLICEKPETARPSDSSDLAAATEAPEMAWMEEELLYARARSAYITGDFGKSLADMDRLLERQPAWAGAALFRSVILGALGAEAEGRGEDPEKWYAAAIAVNEELGKRMFSPRIAENIGIFSLQLARSRKRRGEEFLPLLKRSLETLELARRRSQDSGEAVLSLAELKREICDAGGVDKAACRKMLLEAVADLDELVSKRPQPRAFEKRAALHALRAKNFSIDHVERMGFFDRAAADYEKALELGGPSLSSRAAIVGVLAAKVALAVPADPETREKLTAALPEIDRIVAEFPHCPEARNIRAAALMALARTEEASEGDRAARVDRAVADLEAALRAQPGDVETAIEKAAALELRGVFAVKSGKDPGPDFAAALAVLDGLVERTGAQPALSRRGRLLLSMAEAPGSSPGRDPANLLARASADLDRAMADDPSDPAACVHRSDVSKALSELTASRGGDPLPELANAANTLGKAATLAPRHLGILLKLGQLMLDGAVILVKRRGDGMVALEKAIGLFDQCLEIAPDSAGALNSRGMAHMLKAQIEKARGENPASSLDAALADFDASLAADPSHWRAAANRGAALTLKGRFDEAFEAFERAEAAGGDKGLLEKLREETREKRASGK